MRHFRLIVYTVLAMALFGCVQENLREVVQTGTQLKDGDPVTINGSIELPMVNDGMWGTKAFGETPQVAALYIAVFNAGDILYEIVKANPGTYSHPKTEFTPASEGERYLTDFNVTLTTVLQGDRYVHFIACSEIIPSLEGGGTNMVDEGTFVRDLVTSDAAVAYWARKHYEFITNQTPMSNIPMTRNYAKVQVEVEPSVANFDLLGFKLFNTPKYGTIAPFNNNTVDYITSSGQQMINFERFADFTILEGKDQPYTFMTSNQKYYGFMPPQVIYDDLHTLDPGYNSGGGTDVAFVNAHFIGYEGGAHATENSDYLYECSYRADENPFLILYANYNGSPYFYKADLVYYDSDISGNKYYNILRNFLYKLRITGVNGPGSSSIYNAINSIALNNFEASVESQALTNVADDNYHLHVSSTDVLITSGTSFTMYVKSEDVSTNPHTDDNDNISAVVRDATSGSKVVSDNSKISISESNETSGVWSGWRKVTITCANPDNLQQGEVWKQPIVFKNAHGLTRIVNLTLRRPFLLSIDAQDYVAPTAGTECYVDISIPAGFTVARFPMYFYFEQEDNTLYPKPLAAGDLATLSVESGPTNIPEKTGNNYYYRRTITWTEYRAADEDINGIKVFRSWFKTLDDNSATTIWVAPSDDNAFFYPSYYDDEVSGRKYDRIANSLAPCSVKFQYYGMQLSVGGKESNTASATSGAPITYTSSNTSVATVSSSGIVTGISAGTATITASCDAYNGYTASSDSYDVEVTASSLSNLAVAWNYEPTYVVKVGSTVTTTAAYTKDDGYGGTVTTSYSSSNTDVATVNVATGVVTGVAAGTSIITYTASAAASGDYAATSQSVSYTITVVTAHPESGTMYHSETFLDPARFFSDTRFGDYTIASEVVRNFAGTDVTSTFYNYTTFKTGNNVYSKRHVWYHYYNNDTRIGYGAAASGYVSNEDFTYYEKGGKVDKDYHNICYTSSTRMVSKAIDLSCSAGATLTFYHAGNYFNGHMAEDAIVRFSSDGGSSWSGPVSLRYPDGNNWLYVKAQVDIPAAYLTANFKIAFDYVSVAESFSQKVNGSSEPLYYEATTYTPQGGETISIANRSEETTTVTAFPVMVSDGNGRAGTWEIKNLSIVEK